MTRINFKMQMNKIVPSFVVLACLTIQGQVYSLCPVTVCADTKTTELERWICFSEFLFGPSSNRFIEQQCDGLGWGNSIASLSVTVELAALLNARVIFTKERQLGRLWTLPREYEIDHSTVAQEPWIFDFDENSPKSYRNWVDEVARSGGRLGHFNDRILQPSLCGKDVNVNLYSNCTTATLLTYGRCVKEYGGKEPGTTLQYFELDTIVSLPAFFAVFRRPAPLLVKYLQEIRARLSLPPLAPDAEPYPGSWGLWTPGYYLLAFHYRGIPLGFEPMSVMLNEGHFLENKAEELREFWAMAKGAAQQARDIARCRNESLLIYFATDDVDNMRPLAEQELGGYGRVAFGLEPEDVGHMQPYWTSETEKEVEDKKVEVLRRKAEAQADCAAGGGSGAADAGGTCAAAAADPAAQIHVVSPLRSEAAMQRHRDMALVEWWILGSAQVGSESVSTPSRIWVLAVVTASWTASEFEPTPDQVSTDNSP